MKKYTLWRYVTFVLLYIIILLQEKVYLGNTVSSTTNVAPFVGGPNVCRSRYDNYCCPGWKLKSGTNLCITPVCWKFCGDNGSCIKPNICICENGAVSALCSTFLNSDQVQTDNSSSLSNKNDQSCPFPCLNGGTCVNGLCICKTGYTNNYCSEPVCKEQCLNGGKCIGPDRCACVYGYAGQRCEADYRVGPCYRKIVNDMCQNQLKDIVCTKQLCCATIGLAWGHPCEHCPLQLDCDVGFLRNIHSKQCVEIDECEAISSICDGGKCINTIGSFQCTCPEGKIRNHVTNVCEDENECANVDTNVCQHGQCVNTDGSYFCICDRGYIPTYDKKYCLDARQGKCYISINDKNQCNELLPIVLSKVDCCCANMGKAWGEDCEICHLSTDDEYGKLCKGVEIRNYTALPLTDECTSRLGICRNGRCISTGGGFVCECFTGYKKINVGNAQLCEDINECEKNLCNGGQCSNTVGSYTCVCPAGYYVSSDGKQCIDYNECNENEKCSNGICVNTDGSFKCQCHSGYVLSPISHSCVDIDECQENSRICLNGRCVNTVGSYRCECQLGFTPTLDGGFCVDINECGSNPAICENGKCINTEGSFRCICNSGYQLKTDKKNCTDFNECTFNICQHGKCINTIGSFYCECPHGFFLESGGRTCSDSTKDICYAEYKEGHCSKPLRNSVTKSNCCCGSVFSNISLAWGTSCTPCPISESYEYNSLCPHGSGMTFNGDDINECAQNPTICENGACENLMGTYRCICNDGYEPDQFGKICVDINECDRDKMICNIGQCKNSRGSFQCICPPGTRFSSSFNICEDINECFENDFDACLNGKCINTFESFECECHGDFILDNTGRICLDNRKSSCWTNMTDGQCENNLPQLISKIECCCSIGVGWGSPCELCRFDECNCSKGYAKVDGKTCSDINECELNEALCRGGTCLNTEGSFTCICPFGFTFDSLRMLCHDTRLEVCYLEYKFGVGRMPLDEKFSKSMCCCSTIGKAWGNKEGLGETKYEQCPQPETSIFNNLCPKGTGFVDKKDINECAEFPRLCRNGHCKNNIGGYSCICNPGFTQDEHNIECTDVNECSIMHGVCGDNGTCINLIGSFKCQCAIGYENDPLTHICIDTNECEKIPGLCQGGNCSNDLGSYHCECSAGHELSVDKQSCKDIDECSRTSGICSNGKCENMMGTYQCICDYGYQQTNQKFYCEDINECEINNGGCEHSCTNIPGSFLCKCSSGFHLTMEGRSCMDMNECDENSRICNNGECINTIGSYYCICGSGLHTNSDNSSCIDINECESEGNGICGNGQCINNIGSYTCQCDSGYSTIKTEYGNIFCTDDDECAFDTYQCDKNAICINNPGAYSCRCLDGYIGNGMTCFDIDECLTNNGGCNKYAQCINTDGSFQCTCDEGFRGNGYVCDDIDACIENLTLCENGHCINYPGSFRCECEMGFINSEDKDQQQCLDINECETFDKLCIHGRCENTVGTFKCECNPGYQIDNSGGNCTDINECESSQACLYGNCTNTEGSFICKCPPNLQLTASGNACVDDRKSRCYMNIEEKSGKRRCSQDIGSPVTKATCCCSVGKAWGGRCESCPTFRTEEFKQLCPSGIGYRPNTTTVTLEDINECKEHENLCKNGHCTNTFGSYMCICNDGFRFDKTRAFCNDIDDCAENANACGVGFCINDEGSYHCICPDGYMILPNGKECIDTRKEECFLNYTNGMCSELMSNVQTRMICCCSMGQAWGKPCQPCPSSSLNEYLQLCGSRPGQIKNPLNNLTEEINECSLMPQMCNHGKCINTPGSFHCLCDLGYIYDEFLHQCNDENECALSSNSCTGISQCLNTPGSYECQCPVGYKLGFNMNDCIDVDECNELYDICKHGECTNLDGSFQCTCKTGYTLTTDRKNCADLNECQRNPNICNNGTCINLDGSFKCECHTGFKLSHNNDCIDIDECTIMPHLCRNGRCKNTIGSFYCECAKGYILTADNQHCKDIDECQYEQDGRCPPPGRCQNILGSYICICPSGYRLTQNKTFCEDINECLQTNEMCTYGNCTNIDGGAICKCPTGFKINRAGTDCIDTRQEHCYQNYSHGLCLNPRIENITMKECCCSLGAAWGHSCNLCPASNTAEFTKLCPMGVGRKDRGEDLNECILMPHVCENGECINTDGSFRCKCPIGYILDTSGEKCIDDNECVSNNTICGNGTCTNVDGSFECSCVVGFMFGNKQTCEDINECLDATNECAFRCHNTKGSYKCICPYGYELAEDGKHCRDIDECLTSTNGCNFKCRNLIGSFVCECPEGYNKGVLSNECHDIDECSENRVICKNGRCINKPGTYECDCFDGYEASVDGKRCLDERIGFCYRHLENGRCVNHNGITLNAISRGDCCCTKGKAWGPLCQLCPVPETEEFLELCVSPGYSTSGHDIDECSVLPDLCKNGICINTLGSYKCMCSKGYKIDRNETTCADVDECLTMPSPCQMLCENTPGSYACSCVQGFTLNRDNSTCRDIDECLTRKHICQQSCINTNGSYECSCNPGYKKVGDHCLDIDECAQEGICPLSDTCINTIGSYRCLISRGHKIDSNNTLPLNINLTKCYNGNCESRCKNCSQQCPTGFSKHPRHNECVDNNECLHSPCGLNQCINTIGSYHCVCPPDSMFDENLLSCVQIKNSCAVNSCVFGCTQLSIINYICECPSEYQRIGQEHCFSTINPLTEYGNVPNLKNDISTYPVYSIPNNSNIVSMEGCFSCKINGKGISRNRRTISNLNEVWKPSYDVTKLPMKINSNENEISNVLDQRNQNEIHVELILDYEKMKFRPFILNLRSAIKNEIEYILLQNEDSVSFQLTNETNIWTLSSRYSKTNKKKFDVQILAKSNKNESISNQLFKIHILLVNIE